MPKYQKTIHPIYYAADSRKSTKKNPVIGPRLVHRMSCGERPLAKHQLCLGMHEYIADALAVAAELKPDWELAICPKCQASEDERVPG